MERRLAYLASAVVILNLLDAVFTLVYTEAGYAVEANPLMAAALRTAPIVFVAAKLSLVSLGVWFLWRVRRCAFAAAGLVASATAYTLVVAYHVTAMPRFTIVPSG